MSDNQRQTLAEDVYPAGRQQSSNDNVTKKKLTTMQPQTPAPSGMSQVEERVFELQLQAVAAVADNEASLAADLATHIQPVKQRRLGRACDACSKRKVKCGDEIPCKNCVDLDLPCTFARPAKRRGPANKVAEDMKRARHQLNDINTAPSSSDAISASALTPSSFSLDSIAPFELLYRILENFYTYVYAVFPFPHEHLTMERLRKREDNHNSTFCALILSLLATLSALFPRLVQTILGQHEQDGQAVSVEAFTDRCMFICEQLRGPLGDERNVDDAATAFFIGVLYHLRGRHAHVEMFLTESLAIIRFLGVEREGILADGSAADFVTNELCRRIYWAIESFIRSLRQTNDISNIIGPRKPTQLPAFPSQVDDYYIYSDHIQEQPPSQISLLGGFNLIAQIAKLQQSLVRFEFSDDSSAEGPALRATISSVHLLLPDASSEVSSIADFAVFSINETLASQQAREGVRRGLQKILLRSEVISTQHYLARRLVACGGASEDILTDVYQKCLHELAELTRSVTLVSLEPIVKLVLPRLHVVLSQLQKDMGASLGQNEEMIVVSRKFTEWFESL